MIRKFSLLLIAASTLLAGVWMSRASKEIPWYRFLDMNIHNVDDALSINDGQSPNLVDQPGFPLKYLLALDYRMRHAVGQLPTWNMTEFAADEQILPTITQLIRIGRTHSQGIILLSIVLATVFTYLFTRNWVTTTITTALLAGSEGLLFHGLMTRPELWCAIFGNVLALACTWWATTLPRGWGRALGLLIGGIFIGLSVVSKIPGMWYLVVCLLWCWLAPAAPGQSTTPPANVASPSRWLRFSGPLISGVIALGIGLTLFLLDRAGQPAGDVVKSRVMTLVAVVALLPWLFVWPLPAHRWASLRHRSQDCLLLLAGAATLVPLTFLALSIVLPAETCATYTNKVLHVVFNPGGLINELATNPEPRAELFLFLSRDWIYFSTAGFVTIALFCATGVPRSTKAFVGLMLFCAVGITLMMSKRYYSLQYPIYDQLPLILTICLGLDGLWKAIPLDKYRAERHILFGFAAAFAVAAVLTAPARLRVDYLEFQYKQNALPHNHPLSLIFLYHHDAHTPGYLKAMSDHFGSKENFIRELEQFDLAPEQWK